MNDFVTHRSLRAAVFATWMAFVPFVARAQAPVNDLFDNAITLSGPIISTTGSNVGATKQGGFNGEPSIPGGGGANGGASVWWKWTAIASGPTTIDTEGSDFNTLLGVWTGSAQNQLTFVAGNDDFQGHSWSRVTFEAVGGTTYRVMVDGFRTGGGRNGRAATGNIKLNIAGIGGVDIAAPLPGVVYTVGDPIPLTVTINSDFPNPPAGSAGFYANGNLFATLAAPPYTAVATNLPAGTNTLYVVVNDSTGAPIKSPEVKVFVQRIGVTVLTPFEDTMFLSSANPVTITAWGYLPSGSISSVDFLVDGVKVAESTAAPFSGIWATPTGGSHRITAIGTSDTGAKFTSQPVNIGVATTLVATGAVWKYLDNGSDQGTAWQASNFDDSAWASGPAELGYGDGDEATVVNSGPANAFFITTYFRQSFEISPAALAGAASITASLERDDAAVLYLNGREVFRSSNLPAAPAPITFDLVATGQAVEDTIDTFQIDPTNFVAGLNVFAVEVHQQAANSSDISFNFGLQAIPTIIHNLSPEVALTSPTNTQYFLAASSVTLTATASDADGSVAKVEFFADGVKIGEDATAPYSVVWNSPSVAAHILTAVATDDQGATTTSAEVLVVTHDAAGTPVAAITSPVDNFVTPGPTNWLVTATANGTGGVARVEFRNNGVAFGTDTSAPYSAVWTAPFGTNLLTAVVTDLQGNVGTSPAIRVVVTIPPTNTVAPTVATQAPLAGETVTNLTSISVTFSENVHEIDASDLLINGVPATGVNFQHSRSNYTFTFPQPPYGPVTVSWAVNHGILDYGWPAELPFDRTGPGATWSYTLIDKDVPVVTTRVPAAGAIVTNLTQIEVNFSETVTGVDATDLLVNDVPALSMTGSGTHYTFTVPTPGSSATSVVNVTWSTNTGIFDVATQPNAFVGTSASNTWRFVYDPRVTLIASNSVWRFVKGLAEASEPINAWRQFAFDDSSWSNAPAPFFFGDPYTNATVQGTLLSDMASNYTSIFLRQEFHVEKRGEIGALVFNHQTDDGLIAWLNGVEVLRYNMPGASGSDLPYNTNATAAANEPGNNGAGYIVATLGNSAVSRLRNGTNVLAVQVFNQNLTNSSDFGFNAHLYYFPIDPGTVPPRVVSIEPTGGDVFALDHVTFNFSEGVTNVQAADLFINGTPAASVTSTTNSVYTFHFAQPAYGAVAVRWATNHGIVDFDAVTNETVVGRPFDGNDPSSIVDYVILNPNTPRIVTKQPAPNSILTGLTSLTISFDKPVAGLDASDLLVSGTPATSLASAGANAYTFRFVQPPFGAVSIRWSTNHGITDLSIPPAPFYPDRFGHQWDYTLIDPVPSVTITSPTNNTFFLPPATVTMRATASDNDGTVALVQFFLNGSKLTEFTNAPYSYGVSNLDLGSYTFSAIAQDNQGLLRTSAPVVINVVTSLPIALIRGPYLNSGSITSGVVRWRTDAISDALVFYGTDPNNLTRLAREESITNEHIVTLTGMQPDTTYYYSIGSAAYRLVGGTNDGVNYWFKTAPVAGTRRPFKFWILGDAGTAGNGAPDRQQSTRDAFYAFAQTNGQPDIWLMLGDNAYNSGTDTEHQAAIFDMYPTTLRNRFLWPTIGNHETAQSTTATDFPYMNIFSLPRDGEAGGIASGTEKYYSFDYGNIHFICLDSMTSGLTSTTPMADWLRNDLEATVAEWVIVFFHHPPYTKGNHDSDSEQDLISIRQNILPILESHGVDLVLNGHSHAWERSYFLNGHYGLSSTFTESMKVMGGNGREDEDGAYQKNDRGEGVVYTVAGNAGQVTGGSLNHRAHYLSLNELGTMVVDVNENRLDAKLLRETGDIQDHFTLLKPDPRPARPTGLFALSTGPGQISVSWTPGSENQLNFEVERSADGINFTQVAVTANDVFSLIDNGLAANAMYYYRVRGRNSLGVGAYSAVAAASTVEPDSVPRAPVGLIANSDDGVNHFRSQMVLRWQDRSTNESAFEISRSLDGTTFTPIATVGANIATFVDRNLQSATFYYYQVRAVNSRGASGPSVIAGGETHPQSQLARGGESVTFHAGPEGVAPIRYQWRYMGAALTGETNETLTLSAVEPVDEGDYTVVVYDGTGRKESNPAYLFVVSGPQIITQPDDRVALVGNGTTLGAGVIGTPPTTYQWYRNGAVVPGATSPTLSFPSVQLADAGSYQLVIANEFGQATTRVASLSVYRRPVLSPVASRQGEVLTPITFAEGLNDPNSPALGLQFGLAAGAPTGASINATNGQFQWTPTRSQAPGVYPITIVAQDPTRPDLALSTSFTVTVIDYIEVSTASLLINAGESNSVPVEIFTSAPMENIALRLNVRHGELKNLVVEEGLTNVATTSVDRSDPNSLLLVFSAQPGQVMQSTQQLARLNFRSTTDQTSVIVPIEVEWLSYARTTEGPDPTLIFNDGRVVVVSARPLLEARLIGGQRQLMIYGKLGSNYSVQSRTALVGTPGWQNRTTVTMTNMVRTISAPSQTAPVIYYQLRQ